MPRQPFEHAAERMNAQLAVERIGNEPQYEQRQRQPGSAPQPVANVHATPPHQAAPIAQFGGATLADWTAIIRAIRAPPPPLPTFAGLEHEKWWEMYKSISLTWKKFREVMIHCFANTTSPMRLHAQLYSRKQTEKEATVAIY